MKQLLPLFCLCAAPLFGLTHEESGCQKKFAFDGKKLELSEKQWKQRLSEEEFIILRKGGTERAFTGKYDKFFESGIYQCAGCRLPLYSSKTKYDAHTGWPSFWAPICPQNVTIVGRLFSSGNEVKCARCDGHLGDVFQDGPQPTGLRYCMNSAALYFVPDQN